MGKHPCSDPRCGCANGKSFESMLAGFRQTIKKFGSVNLVVPDKFGFGYSIGFFESWLHPEILLCGLPIQTTNIFLNNLRDRIRNGEFFEIDRRYEDIADGFPVIFKPVVTNYLGEFTGAGIHYYEKYRSELLSGYSVLQMFWSDQKKRFPWERGYSVVKERQPILSRPKLF